MSSLSILRRMTDEGLTADELHAELKRKAAIHVPEALLPCAAIALAGPATSPTSSFVGGHPYLPEGVEWPRVPLGAVSGFGQPAQKSWRSNRAYRFVMQINFAEVPPLPGYPTNGLLQWFVENDELHGLDNNGVDGTGFTVRWYDNLTAPSRQPPSGAVPDELHDGTPPIHLPDGPRALSFTPRLSVPEDPQDLSDEFNDDEIWEDFDVHVEDSWYEWVTEH
ncbi:MAG: DUF1963 domain-containing protein, partial [Stackebrandtia sp.]